MKNPGGQFKTQIHRKKAEELLKNKALNTDLKLSEINALKLFHELEVRQKEIEVLTTKLQRAEDQTVIANEKYINLFDFAPSAYFILSQKGKINELNICGSQILGKERSCLKGKPFSFFISSDTKQVFQLFLKKIFKSKTKEDCEITLSTIGNEPIYLYLTGLASNDAEQCLVNAINITELKLSNNELVKSKEHAEESDRLKTAFLQNMGHEVRTPMNAIIGFSELLIKQPNNKTILEKYVELIKQNCTNLLQIINDILDIAKIESEQLPVHNEKCNLNKLFSELAMYSTDLQKRINKQKIQFSLQTLYNSSENVIFTDKDKLKQILVKLIDNAFKFTDAGKVEIVCKSAENHHLQFYVSDTGIGIPLNKRSIIFEHFAQIDNGNSRIYGGTGLGLSIVKGLVKLLGGNIWVESEPGIGSTFFFTILAKIINPPQYKLLTMGEPAKFQFQDKNILIVEDDLFNTQYLKEILTGTGSNIIHTCYGRDAVQITLTKPVDLVLMDVRLPDIDGYETTRQIRQYRPYLKIIAQTAFALPDERQKAIDAGCNEYINKPIKSDVLLSLINQQLN